MINENALPTILIKVRNHKVIGTGHFFRSFELAKRLSKQFRIVFHLDPNSHLEHILKREHIPYSTETDITPIIERWNISLLLFDGLNEDEGLFELVKKRFPEVKIIAMGYFDYDNQYVDAIINLVNHNPWKLRPDAAHIQYYEGFQYAIVRDEFQRLMEEKRVIPKVAKNVLITFGGADMSGNTEKTVRMLAQAGVSDLNLDIVLGLFFDNETTIADLLHTMRYKAHIHRSVSNMADHILGADLAFCGGGMTAIEMLSVGTPAIIIPQNSREERFASRLDKSGAVKLLNNSASIDDNIADISMILCSAEKRKMMIEAGRTLIDGRGTERICDIITHILKDTPRFFD